MSYVTFVSEIKTALASITDLKKVYDYPETQPSGFPVAMVTESTGVDNFLDTTRNDTTYAFEIVAIMELKSGSNSGYAKLREIADQIIAKIQTTSFSGYFQLLRNFQFSVEKRGSGDVVVFSATLEIRKTNIV